MRFSFDCKILRNGKVHRQKFHPKTSAKAEYTSEASTVRDTDRTREADTKILTVLNLERIIVNVKFHGAQISTLTHLLNQLIQENSAKTTLIACPCAHRSQGELFVSKKAVTARVLAGTAIGGTGLLWWEVSRTENIRLPTPRAQTDTETKDEHLFYTRIWWLICSSTSEVAGLTTFHKQSPSYSFFLIFWNIWNWRPNKHLRTMLHTSVWLSPFSELPFRQHLRFDNRKSASTAGTKTFMKRRQPFYTFAQALCPTNPPGIHDPIIRSKPTKATSNRSNTSHATITWKSVLLWQGRTPRVRMPTGSFRKRGIWATETERYAKIFG